MLPEASEEQQPDREGGDVPRPVRIAGAIAGVLAVVLTFGGLALVDAFTSDEVAPAGTASGAGTDTSSTTTSPGSEPPETDGCGVYQGKGRNDFGAPRDGGNRTHKGQDIMLAEGSPLFAVTSGTAIWAENDSAGIIVSLDGDDGHRYSYFHLSEREGSNGMSVQAAAKERNPTPTTPKRARVLTTSPRQPDHRLEPI